MFVYPKNGQSDETQSRDKYECHKWAQGESGFDPTQPNGGVSPGEANSKRAAYQRAIDLTTDAAVAEYLRAQVAGLR